jgi:predicted permease
MCGVSISQHGNSDFNPAIIQSLSHPFYQIQSKNLKSVSLMLALNCWHHLVMFCWDNIPVCSILGSGIFYSTLFTYWLCCFHQQLTLNLKRGKLLVIIVVVVVVVVHTWFQNVENTEFAHLWAVMLYYHWKELTKPEKLPCYNFQNMLSLMFHLLWYF